jgi:hypothetical protein
LFCAMKILLNVLASSWTALFLVSNPTFCTSSSSSSSRSSSNSNQRALRAEFVRAMEQATGRIPDKESLLSRLKQAATPAYAYPNYDGSSSSSSSTLHSFSTEVARNLEDYQDYGINLTQYALKYIGCSNIKTWSDDVAQEGYSVLKTDRFVVLRLCPRESCSNYNDYGCLERFGDYLIPMELYLQIMAETFFTQYVEYCETCYECMTSQQANNYNNYNNNNGNQNYNYNNNNGGGGRQLGQGGGNAWYNNWNYGNKNNYNQNNDDGHAYYQNNNAYGNGNAGDDAWYNANNAYGDDGANAQQNDDNYSCNNYAICENYKTACQDYTNLAFDMIDYFQCSAFNIGGGVGYMGPHCAADGKTISMGVFSDENCYEFSADLKDMSSYMQVSDSELSAYTSDRCISCLASVRFRLVTFWTCELYLKLQRIRSQFSFSLFLF